VPFCSAVFNLDQVEGVARPADDVPNHNHNRLEVADRLFDVMPDKPQIVHAVTKEPAYSGRLDRITLPHLMPVREQRTEYYGALYT